MRESDQPLSFWLNWKKPVNVSLWLKVSIEAQVARSLNFLILANFETRRKWGTLLPRETKELYDRRPHQIRTFFENAMHADQKNKKSKKNSTSKWRNNGNKRSYGKGNYSGPSLKRLQQEVRSLQKRNKSRDDPQLSKKKGKSQMTCRACGKKGIISFLLASKVNSPVY